MNKLCWPLLGAGAIALAYLLCTAVHAEPHNNHGAAVYEPHPPPGKPDPYANIKNADDQLCCTGEDCKLVHSEEEFYFKAKGGYVLKATNEFIPKGKVAPAPDANYHLCRYETKQERLDRVPGSPVKIRCLMIPPGGT